MADLIVTIDGPAASGKSTAARGLAQKIGASFLDTGAMYRAVTLAAMQDGIDLKNEQELLGVLKRSDFKFHADKAEMKVCIDGVDVTGQIRNPKVTANARFIASSPKVREELVQMQRQFATEHQSIVTEGRDQGTVAFADADIKFFLIADSIERTKRRQAELQTKSEVENLEETDLLQLQKAIEERDNSDRDRTVGPLKPADDAIVIDTTNLNIEQVVDKLLSHVKEKCLRKE